MKQLILSLKSGKINLIDIPIPIKSDNSILIQNTHSLISSGTEGSLINFGKKNLINKAIKEKDRLKIVYDKIKRDGLLSTFNAINDKLENQIPLGYSSLGYVIESTNSKFKVGDRVISNGSHAEFVSVPVNLCHKVPSEVSSEDAVFTIIASIGLQGVRALDPKLGEVIVVYGLGLIGLIVCQILIANGCKVIGIDINEERVNLAKKYGVISFKFENKEFTKKIIYNNSSDQGADGVLICAHTSNSSIINDSADFCGSEGRIVLLGSTPISINRESFYKKQIKFTVSSSYGPGRYDNNYENGQDYPIGFVRWTLNRNFNEILRLLDIKKISFSALISNIYQLKDYEKAYKNLNKSLGIIFNYNSSINSSITKSIKISEKKSQQSDNNMNTCFIGAGNFSSRFLMPLFKKNGFIMHTVISNNGISSKRVADKFGFKNISSDLISTLKNKEINNIIISTPHNLHSKQLIECFKNNKMNVYIDKPLAINLEELNDLKNEFQKYKLLNSNILVGFNRKFSPHVLKLKEHLKKFNSPMFINMNINAGTIPKDHWINNKKIGGGRLIGEGCHFIDLACHLIDSKVVSSSIKEFKTSKIIESESFTISLVFNDSSIANINYLANGSKSYTKEKIEIFCNGSNYIINDFKKLEIFGDNTLNNMNLFFQDKGIDNTIKFFKSMIEGKSFYSFEEQIEVSELIINFSNKL